MKSLSCVRLCDPVDCRPPGSSVHGISQARILEWVAISISRDLPNPGIEPGSPALQADTLTSEPPGKQASSNSLMGLRLLLFCNLMSRSPQCQLCNSDTEVAPSHLLAVPTLFG